MHLLETVDSCCPLREVAYAGPEASIQGFLVTKTFTRTEYTMRGATGEVLGEGCEMYLSGLETWVCFALQGGPTATIPGPKKFF